MQMERAGYYEKKIAQYEKELERLKEKQQLIKQRQEGAERITISPALLHQMITEQERINRQLLKNMCK